MICRGCETDFEPTVATQRYCNLLCKQRARWRKKYHAKNERREPFGEDGWVYFIQGVSGGPIKIGWCTDRTQRLKNIQIGNPETLVMRLALPGSRTSERVFHERFAAHHVRGEWFEPVPELLELIGQPQLKLIA